MQQPFSIRLDQAMAARLERLVRLTGRSKSFHVRHAIGEQIADLEGLFLARRIAKRVAEGREGVTAIEILERRFGLED